MLKGVVFFSRFLFVFSPASALTSCCGPYHLQSALVCFHQQLKVWRPVYALATAAAGACGTWRRVYAGSRRRCVGSACQPGLDAACQSCMSVAIQVCEELLAHRLAHADEYAAAQMLDRADEVSLHDMSVVWECAFLL